MYFRTSIGLTDRMEYLLLDWLGTFQISFSSSKFLVRNVFDPPTRSNGCASPFSKSSTMKFDRDNWGTSWFLRAKSANRAWAILLDELCSRFYIIPVRPKRYSTSAHMSAPFSETMLLFRQRRYMKTLRKYVPNFSCKTLYASPKYSTTSQSTLSNSCFENVAVICSMIIFHSLQSLPCPSSYHEFKKCFLETYVKTGRTR